MLKIVSIFLGIAFFEILCYILFFHHGITSNISNLIVYKEYLNEYLILSLLFLLFFKKNKYTDILLYLLIAFVFIVDIAQFFSYYYSGAFLTITAFDNANQFLLFANKYTILVIMLVLIFYILLIIYLNKIKIDNKKPAFILLFVITFLNLYIYSQSHTKNIIIDKYSIEKGPIKSFVKVIIQYFEPITITKVTLTKQEVDFAIQKKLIYDYNATYPMLKNFFYKHKLKDNNVTKKPNIIVFFVESFSAKYIDIYHQNNKSLITPNIDKLAKKGFFVKNYTNHTFPTIRGIYGQLCSLYPDFRVKSIVDNYNTYKFYNKKCLPSYLNEYGYNTIYFNHGNKKRQEIGRLAKSYGFKKMFFNLDLEKLLKEKPKASLDSDFSDQQISKAIIKYLKSYNKQQPFFIAVSTIETHIGYQLKNDAKTKKEFNDIENSYYNLDDALGKIFNFIEHSKYNNNTIIIVTGDHTRPMKVRKYHSTTYGDLALVIYSPFFKHKPFYANTSSISLAPTILHLINYPNKKNAFEGYSIFETNTNLAVGATLDNGLFYALYDKNNSVKSAEQFYKPNNKYSKYIYDIMHYIFMIHRENRLYK